MEVTIGNSQETLILLQVTHTEASHRLAKARPDLLAPQLQGDIAFLGDSKKTNRSDVVLLSRRVHGRSAALNVNMIAVELHLRDVLLLGPLLVGLVDAVAQRHFFSLL